MAIVSQEVNSEMLEKLADGTYKRKLPKTSPEQAGLGNVDNLKQMPITSGTLQDYTEKVVALSGTSPTIDLSTSNVFTHTITDITTYTITNAVVGTAHSFTLVISQGATGFDVVFPSSVKWQGGSSPTLDVASKSYIVTFLTVDGGNNYFAMFGGDF